jgi:hypothetical protein
MAAGMGYGSFRAGVLAAAVVVSAYGCSSGTQATPPSALSASPTAYTIAGSPSGPISPDPPHTGSWAPLPTPATSAIGCQSGVVAIENVWYAADSYLCLHVGSRVNVTLYNYPSGWSPLVVAPAAAARVTPLKTNPDGSQATTITVRKAGTFTASTDSLDRYAPSEGWTLHVTVRP